MHLQAMFSLCMVESEADEVTLQGVTSVGLKHALDFAYTGQVSFDWCKLNHIKTAYSSATSGLNRSSRLSRYADALNPCQSRSESPV